MKFKPIPAGYEAQLREQYADADEIVDQLVGPPRQAELPEQPGQTIPYLRVNEGASKPLMYIPGFGEGIVNKLPFAAELGKLGYDFILPGQNRKSMVKDAVQGRQPVVAQARNYEAVLNEEGLDYDVPDFLTHSWGSRIFECMVQRIEQRRPGFFKESNVALLAPQGLGEESSLLDLAGRWVRMLKSESHQDEQDFPDKSGATAKASVKTLLANVPRTIGEVNDIMKGRVDTPYLASKVGNLLVLSYAEDEMFPERHMHPGAEAVSWAVPYSLRKMPDGKRRGGRGAVHDDEQLNPSRVAGAVHQFLTSVQR